MKFCSKIEIIELGNKRYALLNLLTGALDIVSKEIKEDLEKNTVPDSILTYLQRRGHIFSSDKEQTKFFNGLVDSIRDCSLPVYFSVLPTYDCNFDCIYCYQPSELRREHETIDETRIDYLVSSLNQLKKDNKILRGELFGGEPLLPKNKKIVSYLLQKLKDNGYSIRHVVTNGFYIPYFLKILNKFDVHEAQVTLDGPKRIHDERRILSAGGGSFDKIVEGIQLLLKNHFTVFLRVNVDKHNIYALPLLAKFIRKKWDKYLKDSMLFPYLYITRFGKVNSVYLSEKEEVSEVKQVLDLIEHNECMRIFSVSNSVFTILLAMFKGYIHSPYSFFCAACSNLYVFDPEGKIYPCHGAVGTKHYIGTYFPEFSLQSEKLDKWRKTVLTYEACKDCKYSLVCGAGCSFCSYVKSGDPHQPDCSPFKEILELFLRFFYKMGDKYPLYNFDRFYLKAGDLDLPTVRESIPF